jgi:carboxymethylenebutenolidase
MIDVPTTAGVADCYLTVPDDGEGSPPVLFIIDAIGLRDRTKEMADRIAAEGYTVLAPNVFYRGGRAPLWPTPTLGDAEERARFMATLRPLASALTPSAIAADGAAYLGLLAELSDGPVGITGYCMGGRVGWTIAATHADRVRAIAGFHSGQMVTESADSPHLLASEVSAEVYWGHADNDGSMTPENIAELDRAMDEHGVRHTTEVYTNAVHGYTMSDMGAYDAAACERHFDALFALLKTPGS